MRCFRRSTVIRTLKWGRPMSPCAVKTLLVAADFNIYH